MAGRAWLAGSMAVLVDIQVRHGTRCFQGRNVTGRVGLLESLQWYRMGRHGCGQPSWIHESPRPAAPHTSPHSECLMTLSHSGYGSECVLWPS